MSRTQIDGVLGVPRNLRSRYCGIVSTVTMSLLSGMSSPSETTDRVSVSHFESN